MSDYNLRRRDILKKTTVASAFPMASRVASAQQSDLETNLEITEIARTSPDAIKEDIRAITGHGEANVVVRIGSGCIGRVQSLSWWSGIGLLSVHRLERGDVELRCRGCSHLFQRHGRL